MRSRGIAIFILLFEALWLNVIVPGHLRGIVQLPTAANAAACPSCCTPASTPRHTPGQPFTPAEQRNCAVCYFCSHITLPPVIAFDHAPLGLLQRLRPDQRDDLFARIVLVPFDSCGPPLCS